VAPLRSSGFPARARYLAFFELLPDDFPGWLAPSPPTPLPHFTGARGGLLVCGQESPGGPLRSSGFPARAQYLAFFAFLPGDFPGWLAPSPPTPLPRFTGARGGLLVGGQESSGGPFSSSGFPARTHCFATFERLYGECSGWLTTAPTSPLPSCPEGEGAIWCVCVLEQTIAPVASGKERTERTGVNGTLVPEGNV